MMNKKYLMLPFLLTVPISGMGDDSLGESEIKELLAVKIRSVSSIALDPTVVGAVRTQNDEELTLEVIKERDRKWTQTDKLNNLKYALQTNDAGRLLRSYVDSNSAFNEAFLTDNQGANVAAYPPTSDYWQGDEEPWKVAFNEGNGDIYVGSVNWDENSDTEAVNVATPVLDNDGSAIGVLVVGVKLSYLEDRLQTHQQ